MHIVQILPSPNSDLRKSDELLTKVSDHKVTQTKFPEGWNRTTKNEFKTNMEMH